MWLLLRSSVHFWNLYFHLLFRLRDKSLLFLALNHVIIYVSVVDGDFGQIHRLQPERSEGRQAKVPKINRLQQLRILLFMPSDEIARI